MYQKVLGGKYVRGCSGNEGVNGTRALCDSSLLPLIWSTGWLVGSLLSDGQGVEFETFGGRSGRGFESMMIPLLSSGFKLLKVGSGCPVV